MERGAINESASSSPSLKLEKIADKTFYEVLGPICDKRQADLYDASVASGDPIPSSYDQLSSKSGVVPTASNPCGIAPTDGIHVVQKGETLYGISKRYGLTIQQIQAWNNMQSSINLNLCQQLKVKANAQPGSTPATTGGSRPADTTTDKGGTASAESAGYWMQASKEHLVKPGESVASLANLYGYTEARFRKMNGLASTEQVRAGQRLHTSDCICPTLQSTTKDQPLPYDQETEKLTPKGGAASNLDVYYRPISTHVVKKEDTLFGIAKQYNTTVDRILELNGMKSGDKIAPDQKIYVQ